MDILSIINAEAKEPVEASAPAQTTPVTPVQTGPPQKGIARDFNGQLQLVAERYPPQHDYVPGQNQYTSPVAYHATYQGRPAPSPSLHTFSSNDLRSPVVMSGHSPYVRHMSTSSMSSTGGGQYQFPASTTPQSPAQQLHYPKPSQQRDIYPHSNAPPLALPQHTSFPQPSPHIAAKTLENGTASQSPQPPVPRQKRYTEPPIWAKSVLGRTKVASGRSSVPSIPAPAAAVARQEYSADGPLGPWESSIMGTAPYEEVSQRVADFLFKYVVLRADYEDLMNHGIEVEIEAKLGQLIDKETNERFQLPIQSEALLPEDFSRKRIAFKSSMTEAQHKTLNDYLNEKVRETHRDNPANKSKPRVEIVYDRKRERDTSYELHPSAGASLPVFITHQLNPGHSLKVRVTHDERTGLQKPGAKIIKSRVASLDIYNPSFQLDCRISINLEIPYEGDVEGAQAQSVRHKDRLSYTQSHYQIDLTQVSYDGPAVGKEHELEIEVSSAAVRNQGKLAQSGEANRYIELVEGLVNNVRVLTRSLDKTR